MSPAATDLYVAVSYADGDGTERYAYAMVPTDAPGVVVHDDWDALGMRASGSNSVSLEGVELPQTAVRGGFQTGDPLPDMERNFHSGLFHAAASRGIAESAYAIARDGLAGGSTAMRVPAPKSPTTRSSSPPPWPSSPVPPI